MEPMVNRPPTFASLLQRSSKSMSQVARESGISISTVSRISSGHRIPSLPMVFKLAPTLGISPTILLEAFVEQKRGQKQEQVGRGLKEAA